MKSINKLHVLFLFLQLGLISCGQNVLAFTNQWIAKVLEENPSISICSEEYLEYDYSTLLLNNETHYLGYIGDDYERMCIDIVNVEKLNAYQYYIEGVSTVKTNICSFSGWIKIKDIREFKNLHWGVDDFMQEKVYKEGIIIAEYELKEDSLQKGSGFFRGVLISRWCLDHERNINYDDIQIDSDNYSNNQFDGTWTSYITGKEKKCAWGHYRIPNSNDLDIGAGEFSVNPKYQDKGWLTTNCNNKSESNILEGIWAVSCENSVAFEIKDSEIILPVMSNQIYIKAKIKEVKTKCYHIYLIEPDDLGPGGIQLDWDNFSTEKPVAEMKLETDKKIIFNWFGFYHKMENKMIFPECEFNLDTNSNPSLLNKCD